MFPQNQPEEYKPWYFRKKPPVYCDCWYPFYKCFRPIKLPLVLISAGVVILGFIFLFAAIIACIAGACRGGLVSLWPLSIMFLWWGLMFFHCGWAAHLLDEEFEPPVKLHTPEDQPFEPAPGYDMPDGPIERREEYYMDYDSNPRTRPVGYWQFIQREPWQATSSRLPLN